MQEQSSQVEQEIVKTADVDFIRRPTSSESVQASVAVTDVPDEHRTAESWSGGCDLPPSTSKEKDPSGEAGTRPWGPKAFFQFLRSMESASIIHLLRGGDPKVNEGVIGWDVVNGKLKEWQEKRRDWFMQGKSGQFKQNSLWQVFRRLGYFPKDKTQRASHGYDFHGSSTFRLDATLRSNYEQTNRNLRGKKKSSSPPADARAPSESSDAAASPRPSKRQRATGTLSSHFATEARVDIPVQVPAGPPSQGHITAPQRPEFNVQVPLPAGGPQLRVAAGNGLVGMPWSGAMNPALPPFTHSHSGTQPQPQLQVQAPSLAGSGFISSSAAGLAGGAVGHSVPVPVPVSAAGLLSGALALSHPLPGTPMPASCLRPSSSLARSAGGEEFTVGPEANLNVAGTPTPPGSGGHALAVAGPHASQAGSFHVGATRPGTMLAASGPSGLSVVLPPAASATVGWTLPSGRADGSGSSSGMVLSPQQQMLHSLLRLNSSTSPGPRRTPSVAPSHVGQWFTGPPVQSPSWAASAGMAAAGSGVGAALREQASQPLSIEELQELMRGRPR